VWPKNARAALLGARDNKPAETSCQRASQGKRALQSIWMVETKAEAAFDAFIETYAVKY